VEALEKVAKHDQVQVFIFLHLQKADEARSTACNTVARDTPFGVESRSMPSHRAKAVAKRHLYCHKVRRDEGNAADKPPERSSFDEIFFSRKS
jgi:hypothetical protein